MSKYKVIKQWFGVEIGDILMEHHKDTLSYKSTYVDGEVIVRSHEVALLLDAGFIEEISDKPWEPKVGENYWTIDGRVNPISFTWEDDEMDRMYTNGMGVYPTKEAAEAMAKKLIAFVKQERGV